MSEAVDTADILEGLGRFVGPIGDLVGAPEAVGVGIEALFLAVSRLIESGRSLEEIVALLEELEGRPPAKVSLDDAEARARARLARDTDRPLEPSDLRRDEEG